VLRRAFPGEAIQGAAAAPWLAGPGDDDALGTAGDDRRAVPTLGAQDLAVVEGKPAIDQSKAAALAASAGVNEKSQPARPDRRRTLVWAAIVLCLVLAAVISLNSVGVFG
jgi:hypothetical protein